MADELDISIQVTYTPSAPNQESVQPKKISQVIDMSGTAYLSMVRSIATSEVEVALDGTSTALGTIGVVMVKNLDASNYIKIGSTTGVYTVRVNAGETWIFRFDQSDNSLFCIADTAACEMQIWAWEA